MAKVWIIDGFGSDVEYVLAEYQGVHNHESQEGSIVAEKIQREMKVLSMRVILRKPLEKLETGDDWIWIKIQWY